MIKHYDPVSHVSKPILVKPGWKNTALQAVEVFVAGSCGDLGKKDCWQSSGVEKIYLMWDIILAFGIMFIGWRVFFFLT